MSSRSELSFDDLCNLVAIKAGRNATSKAARRYLVGLYKVILEQLKINKKISIYGFGVFELFERKSGQRLLPDFTSETLEKKLIYVRPRKVVKFRPSQIFDTNINENDFKLSYSMKKKIEGKKKKNKFFEENVTDLINTAERRSGKQWQNN